MGIKRAAGILYIQEKLILAVKRNNSYNILGFPCGKQEPNESIEQTAIRECKEETGYLVKLNETKPFSRKVKNTFVSIFKVSNAKLLTKYKHENIGIWVKPKALIAYSPWPEFNKAVFDYYNIKY